MSYVQINIGGKDRGLKFNQMADTEYLITVGNNTNPIAHTYAMVWAGLISNCYAKKEEVDFTFEDVIDWCEKVKDTDFTKILECYKETKKFLNDLPEKIKKNNTKKVLQPKNTKRSALK